MNKIKICLASDNWSPAHPRVIEALSSVNQGFAPSYGGDLWTEEASRLIQALFPRSLKVHFIPTGTGANIFALRLMLRRHESLLCSDIAHLRLHESGAVEALVGSKVIASKSEEGKVVIDDLEKHLEKELYFGKHATKPRLLTITQPTELGTLYTIDELRRISAFCKKHDLLLHMDGSRLYNAAASLALSLGEITEAAHVDILTLGGTKCGLIGAEALIIFNPELEEGSDHLEKQTLQLLSKKRYLCSQYLTLFEGELWRELANGANHRAQEIGQALNAFSQLKLLVPVETNHLFFSAPDGWIPHIQEKIDCLLWNKEQGCLRFVTSWNTTKREVEGVQQILSEIAKESGA